MAQASSQVQQAAGTFDGWKKMAEEQVARLGATFEEAGKLEAAALEQAQATVRELARMTHESIAYGGRLAAEWRKLALESARATAELWKAKG